MSGSAVDTVERLYEAWNARDWMGAIALAHPDAEWIPDSRVGEEPVRGRDNVVRFFMDLAEMFDQLRTRVECYWEKDDRVLAFVHVTGSGHASGADFDIRIAHLWTVRDGLVLRGQGYGDRGEALRAAGIDEQETPPSV